MLPEDEAAYIVLPGYEAARRVVISIPDAVAIANEPDDVEGIDRYCVLGLIRHFQ